jgi:hypothetical protein
MTKDTKELSVLDKTTGEYIAVPINIQHHKDGSITINKELIEAICSDYAVPIWVGVILNKGRKPQYDPLG